MAFKLDKGERERRNSLVGDLRDTAGRLEDAISVFNAEVEKLKAPVTAALEAYNTVVEEVRGFAEDIASTADSAISDKSEKWQDGDKGEEAAAWKDEWENAAFDELELTFPDELALEDDDTNHADTLEQLPEAAG